MSNLLRAISLKEELDMEFNSIESTKDEKMAYNGCLAIESKRLVAAKELSAKRKMKISRAAMKLGASPVAAKYISIANAIVFLTDKEDMIAAASNIGHSCMTKRANSYAFWAETYNQYNELVIAVAVYRDGRAIVRLDTLEFMTAYGKNGMELLDGLCELGYSENRESFMEGLTMPEMVAFGVEEMEVATKWHWVIDFITEKYLEDGKWETRTIRDIPLKDVTFEDDHTAKRKGASYCYSRQWVRRKVVTGTKQVKTVKITCITPWIDSRYEQ